MFQRDFRDRRLQTKKRPCVRHRLWKMSIGLHDYRCVAGWYIFLCLAISVSYIFPVIVIDHLVVQQAIFVLTLMLSVLLRPYKHWLHNHLDAFVFILLVLLNTLSIYCYFHIVINDETHILVVAFEYVGIFIPAAIMAFYFFFKLGFNYYHRSDEIVHWVQNERTSPESSEQVESLTGLTRSYNEDLVRRRPRAGTLVDATRVRPPSPTLPMTQLPQMQGLQMVFVKMKSFFCGCEEREVPVYEDDMDPFLASAHF